MPEQCPPLLPPLLKLRLLKTEGEVDKVRQYGTVFSTVTQKMFSAEMIACITIGEFLNLVVLCVCD